MGKWSYVPQSLHIQCARENISLQEAGTAHLPDYTVSYPIRPQYDLNLRENLKPIHHEARAASRVSQHGVRGPSSTLDSGYSKYSLQQSMNK
jgi:hypothetical protein